MSRLLVVGVMVSWMVWAVASPFAWLGCVFNVNANVPKCLGANVHVVAKDLDLSKVACVRAVISGSGGSPSEEAALPMPPEGWPSEVRELVCFKDSGTVQITITAYDGAGRLMGLGTGKSFDYSDVKIELQSVVPWS